MLPMGIEKGSKAYERDYKQHKNSFPDGIEQQENGRDNSQVTSHVPDRSKITKTRAAKDYLFFSSKQFGGPKVTSFYHPMQIDLSHFIEMTSNKAYNFKTYSLQSESNKLASDSLFFWPKKIKFFLHSGNQDNVKMP